MRASAHAHTLTLTLTQCTLPQKPVGRAQHEHESQSARLLAAARADSRRSPRRRGHTRALDERASVPRSAVDLIEYHS